MSNELHICYYLTPPQEITYNLLRKRLIDLLGKRGDGFSDGETLLTREGRWGPVADT